MMVVTNWRDVSPTIVHDFGIDYKMCIRDSNYTLVADYTDLAGGPLVDSFIVSKELADQYPDDVVAILDCVYEAMDRLANDDEARAEYAMDLYLNEGGTTYSDEDMASEIANVTFWTWEQLADPE